MDMKKINDEYLKFYGTPEVKDASGKVIKAKVDGVKDKIETNIKKFEDSIEKLGNEKSYYKVLKSDPARAKKAGLSVPDIDAEIKRIDDELKDCKEKLNKQKSALQKFKADLDKTMDELKKDPAIANTMDEIFAKRYDRKISKLEENKESATKGNKNLEAIMISNRKNPFMESALKSAINLENDKKLLISQLTSLSTTDPNYATKVAKLKSDIKVIESKEKGIKGNILAAVKMEKSEVTLKDIESCVERMGKNVTIQKGDIQLDETLNRTIASYKREIKSIDKQIATNSIAYAKTGKQIENPKSNTIKQVNQKVEDFEKQKLQQEIDKAKQTEKDKIIEAENNRRKSLVPTTKPKWFQFIKKFKQWRNNKEYQKIVAVPVEEALKTEIEKAEQDAEKDTIDRIEKAKQATKDAQAKTPKMRDALKFDIVKQVIQDETNKKWKEAKQTIKDEENKTR